MQMRSSDDLVIVVGAFNRGVNEYENDDSADHSQNVSKLAVQRTTPEEARRSTNPTYQRPSSQRTQRARLGVWFDKGRRFSWE